MDLSAYYRTNVKKSVDEDRLQIVNSFRDILKQGTRVGFRLVNYYKGLPLSYPATMVELDRGFLELDVHKQQAVALEKNGYTFIKCDHFDSAILAQAQNVNVRSMTASLRNFTYVQILAENRNSLRLELEPQTEAEINWQGAIYHGNIIELSLGGLSVRSDHACDIPHGSDVKLKIMVPNLLQNTLNKLETTATLISTGKVDGWHISRFSIVADPQSEGLLSRFIFQRQVEIIRELKENS